MGVVWKEEVEIWVCGKDLVVYGEERVVCEVVRNVVKNGVEGLKEKEREEKEEWGWGDLEWGGRKKGFMGVKG